MVAWGRSAWQVFFIVGSLGYACLGLAQTWPDAATKMRLAQEHGVPLKFWDLPINQQVQAAALDVFYKQQFQWDGRVNEAPHKHPVTPHERWLMSKYLALRIQNLFYDPTSPFYRQAIVTLENIKLEGEARPVLIYHANPSLAPADQLPVAQFLAALEEEFGDRLQIAADIYGIFLMR